MTEIEKLTAELDAVKSERTALLATEQNLRAANAKLLRWIDQVQDEATTLMVTHWSEQ